jgi:hypothetical protein
MFTRPSLSENDIPHRMKIQEEILCWADEVEVRICGILAKIEGKVSFTFDTWTSDVQDPYLSVTSVLKSGCSSRKKPALQPNRDRFFGNHWSGFPLH